MNIQVCRDTSDAVALYLPQRLYLKSFAKLNISVQLPPQKAHGKAISNWELMEKLRKMIQPESFSILKVSKHSSEVIRFDAELESRDKLDKVLSRLDDRVLKLNDFPDSLRVRVSEAKSDYPSRHSWDSFFRDATDMDEMKPGERPDTIHIANLPIRWFIHERAHDDDAPSESIFKRVFEKFGSIRQVDLPAADPYRMQMKSAMRGITTPSSDAALYFEGYVQFSEYVGFVRCMDSLRGTKLLRKKDDIAEWCGIRVDFDKTKHMTDAAVKRRAIVRERLISRQRAKEDEERQEQDKIVRREAKERQKHERVEKQKLEQMREREERRKKKQLAKLIEKDNVDINSAVAEEERRLLKVQKKLQAIRLVEELFQRIELRGHTERNGSIRSERYSRPGEMAARSRIVDKLKRQQEDLLEQQRDRLKQARDGRIVIRSALEMKKPKPRASSISSMSSDEERPKRIKTEKLTTPEREIEYKKALGMYGMPHPYSFGYPFAGLPPGYPYPQTSMYYPPAPVQGAYYPPPQEYAPRRPYRGRGRGRGMGRGGRGNYDSHDSQYHNGHRYKRETEHDDRTRSRSRSRHRSYTRSRSRHRSRSRRRSYSRSRSRSRRSRSRSRRSRSRSRHSRSRSRSRQRSRSRDRRSREKSKHRTSTPPKETPTEPPERRASVDSSKFVSPNTLRQQRSRSKSWSLPKEGENGAKEWSKSPKDKEKTAEIQYT